MSERVDESTTIAATDTPPEAPRTTKTARFKAPGLGVIALWGLLVAPVVLALAEALRSPRLNYWDFWRVFSITTDADGTLDPTTFVRLYNDHPVITVALTFWADAKFFAGSNWVLGVATVVLALCVFAALWRMLPQQLTGHRRLAVLAAFSLLIFSSAAVDYYGAGWMGIQWFLGIAPAVVAISFAHHGRTVPAVVLGLVGSLGHGSAFPVWIALGLVAWLRRDRLWKVLLPLLMGLAVLILWRLAAEPTVGDPPSILGADTYLGSIASVLGRTWATLSADTALFGGIAMLVLIGLAVVDSVKRRGTAIELRAELTTPDVKGDAGWIGLITHMALAGVLVGVGRAKYSNVEGLTGRYSVIGLIAVAGLLALLATRPIEKIQRNLVPIALVIGLGTYAVGSTNAAIVRKEYATQPVLAVAMQAGADSVVKKMNAYPENLEKYRRFGIYPFTPDFTLGCGANGPELGTAIDVSRAAVLPAVAPPTGERTAGFIEASTVSGDRKLIGWAFIDGEQADCVLVTDSSGTVVGGGAVGLPRRDVSTGFDHVTGRAGWEAVAKPGLKDGLVFVSREGRLYRIASISGKDPANG
ncbi:hypothetical protein [Amycolatopsis azurea]|nr:hypothetical protein [Amycolatopsis azurea]OOC05234.1 hypothetical protein B0293_17420 [Amycolatopsis azurea DSM 43854]